MNYTISYQTRGQEVKGINPRHKIAILRVLRDAREAIGSAVIADEIKEQGIDLSDRSIRLYLQEMENEMLVTSARRGRDGGRTITHQGIEEIRNALVLERVGLTATKVDALACQVTFNPSSRSGLIVLNLSLVDKTALRGAVREMLPVFKAKLGMGEYVALIRPGEQMGGVFVPPGKVGVGTVCSVTLNGVLLGARIPTVSRFGGVLEISKSKPVRFTDVIYYQGTSLDPLEIFIKGGLTSVREAVRSGHGRIGAGFREVPTTALSEVVRLCNDLEAAGMGGLFLMGKPHQALLDFPIEEGRTGLIINGGLNPLAAVKESGIAISNHAMCTMIDFSRLVHYKELTRLIEREDY